MELSPIKIAGTSRTPTVNFDAERGSFELKGNSILENAADFFKPILEWLTKYAKMPKEYTEINIQMEYFNTSTSKCILDVLRKLEIIYLGSKNVVVNWFYKEDDEDMLEAGGDYQRIIKIPFKMIQTTT